MKPKTSVPLLLGLLIISISLYVAFHYFFNARKIVVAVDHPLLGQHIYDPSGLDAVKLYFEENPNSRIRLDNRFYDPTSSEPQTLFGEALREDVKFFATSQPSSLLTKSAHFFEGPDALMINMAAATSTLSGKDDFIIRLVNGTDQEQSQIADFINKLPGDRLLLLQDESNPAYTDNAYHDFMKELEKSGRWHVTREKLFFRQANPSDLEHRMKEPYDVLYMLGGNFQPSIGNIIQLFYLEHPTAPIILTPWARSSSLYEIAGPAAKSIVVLSHYPAWNKDPGISAYVDRFERRFGYPPLPVALSIQQTLELYEQAFAAGHDTPKAVKEYILSSQDLATSLGKVSFDKYGDSKQALHPLSALER